MTNVFVYLRVSGKSQVRGDGFLRQFIAIRKYCQAHNLHIAKIFREKGISGVTELEDRPALSELFAALEENGTRTVIVEKLDRLARDLMVQETIIADMQKSGYALLSSCEPDLCSKDPSRVLVRQIFGAISQYEKAMIVLKLRGARDRLRARHGKCDGRKAYGEKPAEVETMSRILAARADGLNPGQIAVRLNTEGVPTRYGKPWQTGTVQRILARRIIQGTGVREQGTAVRE